MQADVGAGLRHLTWRTTSFVLRLLLFLAVLAVVLTTNATDIAQRLQPIIGWLPATWQIRVVNGLALIAVFFAANTKELVGVLRGATVGVDLSRFLEKVPYRERVAFLDRLGPFFGDVIRKAGGGNPVVILIDDLDRCLPDKAVQVLEAIALFLDVDGCVFIIAADRPMIEEAITVRYKDFAATPVMSRRPIRVGEGYFDKIIQLPIQIPPLSDQQFNSFLTGLIADDIDLRACLPILIESLPRNPRKCERYIQTLQFLRSSMRAAGGENFQLSLLVKIVALQALHAPFVEKIKERFELLDLADRYFHEESDERIEATLKAEFDDVAIVQPAIRRLLRVRINARDTFKQVDIRPYVFVLDPVVPIPEPQAEAEPEPAHVESAPEPPDRGPVGAQRPPKVSDVFLRRYAQMFQRLHTPISMPFGDLASLPVSDLAPVRLRDPNSPRQELYTIEEMFSRDAHIVIVGAPGSGKSTLLRSVGVSAASVLREGGKKRRIPILLRLSQVAATFESHAASGTAGDIVFALEEHFRESEMRLDGGAIRTLLEDGRVLLLFDGFDEMPPPKRPHMTRALVDAAARYPKMTIVVATRPAAFEPLGGDFRVYEIAPADAETVQQMAKTLLAASGFSDSHVAQFLAEMQSMPNLWELARNPLLLVALVGVYKSTGVVPPNRVSLLRRLLDVMIERWDAMRGIQAISVPSAVAHDLLMRLAWAAHRAGRQNVTDRDVTDASRVFGRGDLKEVVRALVERTGILVESAPGTYEFVHRAIFEYLVAEHVVRDTTVLEELLRMARQHQDEIVRMALALMPPGGAAMVVDALVEGTPDMIDLAVDANCVK